MAKEKWNKKNQL